MRNLYIVQGGVTLLGHNSCRRLRYEPPYSDSPIFMKCFYICIYLRVLAETLLVCLNSNRPCKCVAFFFSLAFSEACLYCSQQGVAVTLPIAHPKDKIHMLPLTEKKKRRDAFRLLLSVPSTSLFSHFVPRFRNRNS